MVFGWPEFLYLELVVPVLGLVYFAIRRRRRRNDARLGNDWIVSRSVGKNYTSRRNIPPLLFLIAIEVLIIGLARPTAVFPLPSQDSTVVLIFDVSGSMVADDLKPDRLEAAKAAGRTFVQHQNANVRIGVVSFSNNAFIVQSVTDDRDAVLSAIDRLEPQLGTAIGLGIQRGLDALAEESLAEDNARFGRGFDPRGGGPTPSPTPTPKPLPKGVYAPQIMILLSDGESNIGPDPLSVLDIPKNEGIRIYTVGLGKPEGVIVHLQGRAVKVRLDESVLKAISSQTDGEYYNAANESDLRAIYDKLATHLTVRSEKTEITAAFAALGFVIAAIGGFLSLWWFGHVP